MKKNKKLSVFFSAYLILSMILGNLLPVLAYAEDIADSREPETTQSEILPENIPITSPEVVDTIIPEPEVTETLPTPPTETLPTEEPTPTDETTEPTPTPAEETESTIPDPTPEPVITPVDPIITEPTVPPVITPEVELTELEPIIPLEKLGLEKPKEEVAIEQKEEYVEGEILVKYKESKIDLETSSGRTTASKFIDSKSLEKKEELREENISVLTIKDNKTVEQKIKELKKDSKVEYVQPNFQYYPANINTNDTHKDLLWGLDNTGQTVGIPPVSGVPTAPGIYGDINAPEAWVINEGTNTDVIVAVIDSGVAYNHPDLNINMWDGTNCNDDMGNFLGNCNHGYDYQDNDNTPLPTTSSHGTHIAGTIGALKNNSTGIIGVAPNVKIMALKTSLTTADNVKSINFAKNNGATVINASWGSYDTLGGAYDVALYDAIAQFPGLFVAAAGNANYDSDSGNSAHRFYPSGFGVDTPTPIGPGGTILPGLNNIISVTATDQNDSIATFSNYGVNSVDVGAPGTNIYSTVADSTISEDLKFDDENIIAPNLPSGWTVTGTFGTVDFSPNKILYGDYSNVPYINDNDSLATSPTYDFSNVGGATIDFYTACDTEYSTATWYDYMALEVSEDSVTYVELPNSRWDEAYLDNDTDENNNNFGLTADDISISLPSSYLTSNFSFRFRWVTDSSVVSNYGCYVDNLIITKLGDGSDEQYGYSNGTSMAAPHVAGLAALIEGYNPLLTGAEIKDIILTTGDDNTSLSGITVSGKRINAENALIAATPVADITAPVITLVGTNPVNLIVGDSYTDAGATALDNGTVDLTSNIVTTVTPGPVDTSSSGTFIVHYNVSDTAGNPAIEVTRTVNVTVAPDTTAPVITLVGTNPVNLIVGDSYTDAGATALDNVDGDITANIVTTGSVNTGVAGTYTIHYNVSDVAGNPAPEVTRTVNVASVTPPPSSGGGSSGGGGGGGGSTRSRTTPLVLGALLTIPNGCVAGNLFSPITGEKCPENVGVIPGCINGNLFSPITGQKCPPTTSLTSVAPKVLGAQTSSSTTLLRKGSRGAEVMEIQTLLKQALYDCGVVDGIFGQKTKECVMKFQKEHKLVADGIVGSATRALLKK